MPRFNFNGSSIAYRVDGSGKAVLLISGLGGRMGFWDPVAKTLASRFSVIRFDHPGCGESDNPVGETSIAALSQLILALMDELKFPKADIVGHSMGGAIAQYIAIRCPERVGRLVLSATWDRPDNYFLRAFTQRLEILSALGIEGYARAQVLTTMTPEQINQNELAVIKWEAETANSSTDPEVLAARIRALLGFDCVEHLPKINHEALVFAIRDDQVVPAYMSRRLHQQLPQSELCELKSGGHFLPLYNPEPYIERLLSFLGQEQNRPGEQQKILLIGCGVIGQRIISAAKTMPDICIGGILVPAGKEAEYHSRFGAEFTCASEFSKFEETEFSYAIECAGHEGLRVHAEAVLEAGVDLGILSLGALSDDELQVRIDRASRKGRCRVELLSGALGGLDAVSAAAVGGKIRAKLVSSKPPHAWAAALGWSGEETSDLKEATNVYNGSARKAAESFPKNANVAAALALSGPGFDETEVTLIADPDVTQNSHELTVHGDFGTIRAETSGRAVPENNKTSELAALSAIAAIRRRRFGLPDTR